ncbi:MAG: hypothetical protein LUD84_05185 [Clostridiales bacterium]|nr:hypothetical protein [Clostridiales bacterium]
MPFKKNDKKEKHSFSPGAHGTVYLLGALYLAYLLATFLQEAYQGGEDAPSLPLLIVGILVLGGGVVFLGLMAWRMSRAQPTEAENETEEEEPENGMEEETSDLGWERDDGEAPQEEEDETE